MMIEDMLESKFRFACVCMCFTILGVALVFGFVESYKYTSQTQSQMHRDEWRSKESSDFWKYTQQPQKGSAEKGSTPENSKTP